MRVRLALSSILALTLFGVSAPFRWIEGMLSTTKCWIGATPNGPKQSIEQNGTPSFRCGVQNHQRSAHL
jgi:hypothetical protein